MTTTRPSGAFACLAAVLALAGATQAPAQNLINSNTTIHDSLCVGASCVTTESYGNTTIRLKEPNLRVHFNDTSWPGTAAINDWQIAINDLDGGPGNYFAIEDATAGRNLFRVDAGAPENGLYLASNGNLGLGTSVPTANLHIVDSYARVYMQTGPGWGGWGMVGQEAAFSIYDYPEGVAPFRISSGAPANAFRIDGDGDVAVGSPYSDITSALHVRRTDGTANLMVEEAGAATAPRQLLHLKNNGIVWFTLEDSSIPAGDYTGREWNFQNQGGTFRVTTPPGGAGEIEMLMEPDGDMFIKGQLYTGGACAAGCDRVFDADYPLPSIADHADRMRALGHLPNVGPVPESGPFNLSSMTTGILNELEHAHLYIAELEKRLSAQEDSIASVDALRAEVEALRLMLADR